MLMQRVGLVMAAILGLNVGMTSVAVQEKEAPVTEQAKQDTAQVKSNWSTLKTVTRYSMYLCLAAGTLMCVSAGASLGVVYAMNSEFGAEFFEQYHRTRGERAIKNKLAYLGGIISGISQYANQDSDYRYY